MHHRILLSASVVLHGLAFAIAPLAAAIGGFELGLLTLGLPSLLASTTAIETTATRTRRRRTRAPKLVVVTQPSMRNAA